MAIGDENNNQDNFGGVDPAAMRSMKDDAISFASDMEDSANAMSSMTRNMSRMATSAGVNTKAMKSFLGAARDISDEFTQHEDLLKKINEGELGLSEVKEMQAEAQEKINRLLSKADKAKQALADAEDDGVLSAEKRADLEKDIVNSTDEAGKLGEQMATATQQTEKSSSKTSEALGTMAMVFGQMKWGKAAAATGKMAKGMRIAKLAGGGLSGIMKGLTRVLVRHPLGWLVLAVLGTVAAMKQLWKVAVAVDQELTDIGRAMGVGREESRKIRDHYVGMAAEINMMGIEYQELLKAQGALQDSLGTSAKAISVDIVGGMARMIERMHLSTEAAVGFGKAALATNDTVENITLSVLDNVLANQKNTGVMLNGKKIMEETAKVGGQLRGIYAANMGLISESVIKAQMLGKTLGQVAKESRNMLDFHSSIEKEMEAELFLGKQLNLEKMRLAALTGDYNTYMDEVVGQAGTFHEFSSLNVLQQEKLAQALGMSSDALADMLFQGENLEELKEKARRDGREDLLRQYEQMSFNEQWAATVKKLKTMMINLVAGVEKYLGWIPGLLDGITDASDSVTAARDRQHGDVVGGADRQMYDGEGETDSLGRTHNIKFYPKDRHWYKGTFPDSQLKHNQERAMNAQIHVTTRASDMNYVNKTHIYATRFDEQKAGWKRT